MYHTIEFNETRTLDLEISRKQPLERVSIVRGTRLKVQLKPYVMDTDNGPVEMADLYLEDGTATRNVRFASFRFVE